jgi:hypothetical protein
MIEKNFIEFVINEDIKIPERTPTYKYAKYGIEYPLNSDHNLVLIRN